MASDLKCDWQVWKCGAEWESGFMLGPAALQRVEKMPPTLCPSDRSRVQEAPNLRGIPQWHSYKILSSFAEVKEGLICIKAAPHSSCLSHVLHGGAMIPQQNQAKHPQTINPKCKI